jgi:hypothetical protein
MANSDIIEKIHILLEKYESGERTATLLEEDLLNYADALEKVDQKTIDSFRDFASRIVSADLFEGEEYEEEKVADVLRDFKVFLDTIPK